MDTSSSIYNDPALTSARNDYNTATKAATDSQAAGYTLPQQLKDALTQKFSQDNPLVQGRETAMSNYLKATTQAPLMYTPKSAGGMSDVIYTPQEQANLIQGYRALPQAQLSTANYLLGLAQGGIPDIINAASAAQNAQTAQLQGNASLAGDNYKNLLNELSAKADEAYKQQQLKQQAEQSSLDEQFRQKQLAESIREFDVQQAAKKSASEATINWQDEYQQYLKSLQSTPIPGIVPGTEKQSLDTIQNILGYFGLGA